MLDEIRDGLEKAFKEQRKNEKRDKLVDKKIRGLVKDTMSKYMEIASEYDDAANHSVMLHKFVINCFIDLGQRINSHDTVDFFDDFMDLLENHKIKNAAIILLQSLKEKDFDSKATV